MMGWDTEFQIPKERRRMKMKRYLLVGLAALAAGAALQTSAHRSAGPLPAEPSIAQEENPGSPNYPGQPSGPYVQQRLDNQESAGESGA